MQGRGHKSLCFTVVCQNRRSFSSKTVELFFLRNNKENFFKKYNRASSTPYDVQFFKISLFSGSIWPGQGGRILSFQAAASLPFCDNSSSNSMGTSQSHSSHLFSFQRLSYAFNTLLMWIVCHNLTLANLGTWRDLVSYCWAVLDTRERPVHA